MLTRRTALLTLGSAFAAGSQPSRLSPPCGPGSGMPFLAPSHSGGALLSWLEPVTTEPGTPDRYSLRAARWHKGTWSEAREVAVGDHWFINWADYPSIVELESGTLLAHWLDRVGNGSYGYGIRVARCESWASGKWSQSFFAPPSDPKDYSGFLSFTRTSNGAGAVYLAPPPADPKAASAPASAEAHADHAMSEEGHRKTLRYVEFDTAGRATGDGELDPDTCSCCPTALVPTRNGLIAAYRDHLPGEIRDISCLRQTAGQWTASNPVHRDGWVINGCPTDGPALASRQDLVAAAWLTRAAGTAKIQLAISPDAGTRFSAPLRLDEGSPLGRPAVTMLGNDFLVSWLEKNTSGAELRLRRVTPAGIPKPSVVAAQAPSSRTTGFPRLLVADNHVLLAWRDGKVRFTTLDAAAIP